MLAYRDTLQTIVRFGDFELLAGEQRLLKCGKAVAAEPKVVEVLRCLVENAHRTVSKEELLEQIWPGAAVLDGVVHRCVSRARRLIGDIDPQRRLIVTHGRRGYQFVGDATVLRVVSETGSDAAPAARRTASFVGRVPELARIGAALEDLIRRRRGSVVAVIGEPGIGKSRLLAELAAEAERRGARALSSQCSEVPGASPFRPWCRILGAVAASPAGRQVVGELGPRALDVAQLVPEIAMVLEARPAESTLAPDQQRLRFFDSAERLMCRAAAVDPLVVLVDDLHCGDEGTLLFWRLLCQAVAHAPLLLACAYRSEEVPRRDLLARIDAELFRDDRRIRIELGGMSRAEVEALVSDTLAKPLAHELSGPLHERSSGNPFFALELAAHLRDVAARDGALAAESSMQHGGVALSAGIRAVVALRLAAVSSTCRDTLSRAAVIGRSFDLSLLRSVCEPSPDEVDEAVGEALGAGLIEPSAEPVRCRFVHVLVRDVLYDALTPAARSTLHRAIAEAIESGGGLDEHHEELAHHFSNATLDGGASRAVKYGLLAAERATRRLAFEEAARSYELALSAMRADGMATPERRCHLLLDIAESHYRAGDDARARTAFMEAADLARELDDAELLARAAIGASVRFGQPVDFGELSRDSVVLLEEALARLAEQQSVNRALVLACLAFSRYGLGDLEAARADADRSVEVARATQDAFALCVALLADHVSSLRSGDMTRQASVADELIAVSDASGLQEMMLIGHSFRLFRRFEDGPDSRAIDEAIAARARIAERLRQPQGLWWSKLIDASRAIMVGDWRLGEENSRRARDIAERSMNVSSELAYRTQQAQLFMHRGDIAGLLDVSRETANSAPQVHATRTAHVALCAIMGDRKEAAAYARSWHGADLAERLQPANWLFEAACLAELAFALRDRILAESVYAFMAPHEAKNVMVGQAIAYCGPVARYLGMLATVLERHEEGIRHFEHALERSLAVDALPYAARSQAGQARLLRLRGDTGDAAKAGELLEFAREIAHRTDAGGIMAEIALIEAGVL